MSASSRREPSSHQWQLRLFYAAAWFAVGRVNALSLYGLAGTSRPETNSLSLRSAPVSLSQGYTHVKASTFVVLPLLVLKSNWQDQVASSLATCHTADRTRFIVTMGKGDGKKKRKKKDSSFVMPASMTTPLQPPPPQRVSNDINVPIRMQIKYGQMRKEMAKQASTSFRKKKVERTKYRRTWGMCYVQRNKKETKSRFPHFFSKLFSLLVVYVYR